MPPIPILRGIALVTSVMGLLIVVAGISTQPTMSFFFGKIPSTLAWIITYGAFYYAHAVRNVGVVHLLGLLVLCIVFGVIGTPGWIFAKLFKKKKQSTKSSPSVEEPDEEDEDWLDKIQKTILRIPVRIILVQLAILETVFNSMVLREGALETESWFWDKLFEKREKFYDYEEVYGKRVQNNYPEELWIFVNGITTELRTAKKHCKRLNKMFGRPVKLLHNPTNGIVLDLMECAMGKTGLLRHGSTRPRELLKKVLSEEMKKEYKKIVLVAHSQGTIIAGNVIADFSDIIEGFTNGYTKEERETVEKNMRKFEVYIVSGCAHHMTGKYVSHLECISNRGDLIAIFGHMFPKILRPIWRNTWNKGILYEFCKDHIENSKWGHFIFDAYLGQIKNGLFSESKLAEYYHLKKRQEKEK